MVKKLYSRINFALDKASPLVGKQKGRKNNSWYGDELRSLKKRVDKYFKSARQAKTKFTIDRFNQAANEYKKLCKKRKKGPGGISFLIRMA